MGLGWAAIAVAVFLAVPDLLVGLFLDPDEPLRADIVATGRVLLAIAALFQIAEIKAFYGVREQCLETLLAPAQCETMQAPG